MRKEVWGFAIIKPRVLSSYIKILTEIKISLFFTVEEKIAVASLNCLQKEGVLTPNCPSKGPNGGPVVAAPAGRTVSNSLKIVLFWIKNFIKIK